MSDQLAIKEIELVVPVISLRLSIFLANTAESLVIIKIQKG